MSRRERGVSLIELLVVLGFIAMFAVALAPNYVSLQRGQEDRAFLSRLRNILATGKVRAVEQREAITLTLDENGAFALTSPAASEDENDITLASLEVPDSFTISRLFANDAEMQQEDWTISFFADGTSDGGAIELDRGEQLHIFVVDPESSSVKTTDDSEQLGAQRRWPAGSYETRQ